MCILDDNGRRIKQQTIRGPWDDVIAVVRELEGPLSICFEATCGYGYLYDALRRIAGRVIVAHPGHLRLIFRSKRKNDRVDAEKLAKLLYLDEVPPAYVPSMDVRHWRQLIEYRRRVVDKRTRCKNAIRALLRGSGVAAPRGLWTRKGLAWLKALAWPDLACRVQRDLLLTELETFNQQVRTVTGVLDQLGRAHPGMTLLQTIPGVGPRTAETIIADVDDPGRFGRTRQLGSYFGLVPSQDASGGYNRLGHITKQGPATARKYLVEAAWQATLRSPTVRAYYQRILNDQPERRKIALVATAHYLLRCMHAMLRSGEVWREAA